MRFAQSVHDNVPGGDDLVTSKIFAGSRAPINFAALSHSLMEVYAEQWKIGTAVLFGKSNDRAERGQPPPAPVFVSGDRPCETHSVTSARRTWISASRAFNSASISTSGRG